MGREEVKGQMLHEKEENEAEKNEKCSNKSISM